MNYTCIHSFSEAIDYNRSLESVVERMNFPKKSWVKPMVEVCQNSNYSESLALAIMQAFDENESFPTNHLSEFPLDCILNYLRATHRYYLEKKLPEIVQTFANLVANFKNSHPDLVHISSLFIDYKEELSAHIYEEEQIVFPYIDFLIQASRSKEYKNLNEYKYGKTNLKQLEHSHDDDIEKSLTKIQQQIGCYANGTDSVLPFSVFLSQIDFFAKDLSRHGMMEDLVLIPQAKRLELSIRQI